MLIARIAISNLGKKNLTKSIFQRLERLILIFNTSNVHFLQIWGFINFNQIKEEWQI